jgi:predicted ATPase
LDEIENGLHPELIERLVKYLSQAKAQIIVTTHSPLILNYLSDEEAKEAMILLYRNHEGKTRSCRYFDLPSTSKKLGILGPGEVYVDTSIEQLAIEAEEIEQKALAEAGVTAQ